jgi:hypothetical protein
VEQRDAAVAKVVRAERRHACGPAGAADRDAQPVSADGVSTDPEPSAGPIEPEQRQAIGGRELDDDLPAAPAHRGALARDARTDTQVELLLQPLTLISVEDPTRHGMIIPRSPALTFPGEETASVARSGDLGGKSANETWSFGLGATKKSRERNLTAWSGGGEATRKSRRRGGQRASISRFSRSEIDAMPKLRFGRVKANRPYRSD